MDQIAHEHARQALLIDDYGLSPARRIAQLVLMGRTVVAAAVVQVEHQNHLGMPDEILNATHHAVFRVAPVQPGELTVHVTVEPTRALDNTGEIEIWHHPQAAPANGVVRGQQRGGGKAAGLIALDAAHHQDHLPALIAQAHQGKVQRGHRGRGRSPRPQAAKNRQGQRRP